MVTYSLPIKCMEAVILSIYLTNQVSLGCPLELFDSLEMSQFRSACFSRLVRFPVTFKSCHNGVFYYHIVLGVIFDGKFGSVRVLVLRKLVRKKPIHPCSSWPFAKVKSYGDLRGAHHTRDLIKYVHSNYDMAISLWYFDAFFTFLRVITENKPWHVSDNNNDNINDILSCHLQ